MAARERWFLAPTHKRQGPVPLAQLVEGLLRLPDPRACLVWRHGLPAWTAAGEVPEVDQHLAPFVAARKPAAPRVERAAEAASDIGRIEPPRPRSRPAGRAPAGAPPSPLIYLGAGAGAVALTVLVWVFWPKPAPRAPMTGAAPGIITLKEGSSSGAAAPSGSGPSGAAPVPTAPSGPASPSTSGGASTLPPRKATGGPTTGAPVAGGAPATTPGAAPQGGFAGWSDQEGQLPASELAKLRGVAGWSEASLEFTVYNGSTWRITQLFVLPSRLKDDNFVDDERPLGLLPAGAQVDQGVDKLLSKVAPDRRKPGVNPLDTGKFVAEAGSRPEAFRAPIVGAMGYPPR
jgi:GYF domain 2